MGLGLGLGWAHQELVGRPRAELAQEYGGEPKQADDLDVAQDRRAHLRRGGGRGRVRVRERARVRERVRVARVRGA